MKDPAFIRTAIQRGHDATAKLREGLPNLTPEQLNWKPDAKQWSIGECLEHLIVSDTAYFPALERIAAGTYAMTAWERFSPFSKLFGRLLTGAVQEEATKKMPAPKLFQPTTGTLDLGVIDRFHAHQSALLGYIAACAERDLDTTVITSPPMHFVTYPLRSALQLLVQHQHRHLNQALRVKGHAGFPG